MNEADALLEAARAVARRAYAPYSGFRVGAAVLADGVTYVGCNVENPSFGLTMCAERVAIFTAVAAGARRLSAVALACIDATQDASPGLRMPCGACRQVMAEFGAPDLPIFIDHMGVMTLGELAPHPFAMPPPHPAGKAT